MIQRVKRRAKRPAADRPARDAYHHGDLGAALHAAARAILEEEGLAALSLRSVARRAGVSHAAPYRHYENVDALLADVAAGGFEELRAALTHAGAAPGERPDRIARIGAAYVRFAATHAGLFRLMLGSSLANAEQGKVLHRAADSVGQAIGDALDDDVLGLAVWGAAHGLAILTLEDLVDLGQREAGLSVLPSRAEIVLRTLFGSPGD